MQILLGPLCLDVLGVHEHEVDAAIVRGSGVGERLVNALIGILQLDVFSNNRDADAFLGRNDPLNKALPVGEFGFFGLEVEKAADC